MFNEHEWISWRIEESLLFEDDLVYERNLRKDDEKKQKYYLRKCGVTSCSGKLILKIAGPPYRYYWGCSKSKCIYAVPLYMNQKMEADCPNCHSNLIIKFSDISINIGCSNHPFCRFTDDLPFRKKLERMNDLHDDNR